MAEENAKAIYVFSELDDDALLSLNDTANLFGITTMALRNWVNRGVGPKPIRVGGSTIRFPVGTIRRYLDERAKAAKAEATKAASAVRRIGRPRWSESEEAQNADAA